MRFTVLITTVLFVFSVVPGICFAQNKVVVIPLGADCPAGLTDGAACTEHLDCHSRKCIAGKCAPDSRFVFVSSKKYTGAGLDGLIGADLKCQKHAKEAGLPGIYRAWLSDGVHSPHNRFVRSYTAPYIMLDGKRFASGWFAVVTGAIDNRLTRNEKGINVLGEIWTNTDSDGKAHSTGSGYTCENWTDDHDFTCAAAGDSQYTDARWTLAVTARPCWQEKFLYCFEQ